MVKHVASCDVAAAAGAIRVFVPLYTAVREIIGTSLACNLLLI